uniref:Uncharacterized protein n=1 Tax=Trypanosoma vivax (strain Y486) TaxID=1055687 RepID=G0TY72_TRYVY|nr:hypothetical protein TVY486_0702520 [Trypanosoma vivax Y486]
MCFPLLFFLSFFLFFPCSRSSFSPLFCLSSLLVVLSLVITAFFLVVDFLLHLHSYCRSNVFIPCHFYRVVTEARQHEAAVCARATSPSVFILFCLSCSAFDAGSSFSHWPFTYSFSIYRCRSFPF